VNTSSAVNPGVDINRPSISTISLERNYSRTMPNQAWVGLPSSWFNVSSQFRAVKLDTEVVVGPDALLAKPTRIDEGRQRRGFQNRQMPTPQRDRLNGCVDTRGSNTAVAVGLGLWVAVHLELHLAMLQLGPWSGLSAGRHNFFRPSYQRWPRS
jgi:hypothetical protein